MKQTLAITLAALILAACADNDKQLRHRAAELCRYIPDHQLLEQSRGYLTDDFYALLDTMFNLPDQQPLDHEWLYYFVTGNGGTIADYTVTDVERTDKTHATATISVRQRWEDGSFDETSDTETHTMLMEKVNGQWLMADFDDHKADCIRHIATHRQEQAVRDAIADYLVDQIGSQYLQGQICVPTIMIVAADQDSTLAHVWGDFWVEWYDLEGDTLKCTSGGNHSGLMTIQIQCGKPTVTAFEQTVDGAGNVASARRIFGPHYDIYHNIHSNPDIRQANRSMQLQNHIRRLGIAARYYQDYGWPAVEIGM